MRRTVPQMASGEPGVWLDLYQPSAEEVQQVEARYGVKVPDLAALCEIETTSRLRAEGEALYMSAPMIAESGSRTWQSAPTGFILVPETLITVRYAPLEIFDTVAAELETKSPSAGFVLARLIEEVVDRSADQLEHAAELVSSVSQTIFSEEVNRGELNRETRTLRRAILEIGRASDRSARVRYMLLSIGRMIGFVIDRCEPELSGELTERLTTIQHDLSSLDEFETSLSGRVQLLQDAATGLISIEQNDVVKVLTVASVVGVPPVLVVGVYGMNFRYMPELAWHWRYPFALLLCLMSAVIPYAWFKWKGWI